jgi:ATP-dependent RNA helicase RhlE
MNRFEDIGLAPEILRAVTDAGYLTPTPIQSQAIPIILAGHDVMGGAQTGTGKTAGFTLPMLHRLAPYANNSPSPAKHPIRALIVCPTRELAMQVFASVETYGKYLSLRAACIYGGVDIKAQIAQMKEGREIVVATPGRLLDHVQQKTVGFSCVEFLVLDEADRMLDMGFMPDIRRIIGLLPTQRQNLLFSATFSNEIKKLADSILKNPQLIEVARRNTVSETISHRVHPVLADKKRQLLLHLLKTSHHAQVLVFVATKFGASRLAHWLERSGINAMAIHGDRSQAQRTQALTAFKSGTVRVLVATDVAARGLDIDDLPHVINYELPRVAEDYVHRIGRTGRAGKSGDATSLVAPEEKPLLADIEKLIKMSLDQIEITGFESPLDQHTDTSEHRQHRPDKRQDKRQDKRTSPQPRAAVQLPPPSAHLPTIAPDGFDFSKPYSAQTPSPSSIGHAEKPSAHQPSRPPLRPIRPVAALLGGLVKK